MKITHHLAALLLAATLFAACTREDNDTNAGANCKIAKSYIYGINNNGLSMDSLIYVYTGENITKRIGSEYYLTFDYTGGRVTRRNYFDSPTATASTDYETISYNSDGTVSKIESYSEGGAEMEDRYDFAYHGGKLTTFTYTPYWDGVPGEHIETHFFSYTNGNITRDSFVQNETFGPRVSLYNYSYDAQANHLHKSGANALFHAAVLTDELDGGMLPFFFSANNVTGFREEDDNEQTAFSYTTDANGNLAGMKVDGVPGITWQYQCR